MSFVVGFPTGSDQFKPLHASKVGKKGLNVQVVGEFFDPQTEKLRPRYSEHPMFPNPGSGPSEIIVGGGSEYVKLTKGPRSGLLVWKGYANEEEDPKPVSKFYWLDELDDNHPIRIEAEELMIHQAEQSSQGRIKWPEVYAVYDFHKFPAKLRDDHERRLSQIAPPEINKMTKEERQAAQKAVSLALGPGFERLLNLGDDLPWRFWKTMKKRKGKLLANTKYGLVDKNVDLLAWVPKDQEVQVISQKHALDMQPLHGKNGQFRYSFR